MKKSASDRRFDCINYGLTFLIMIITIYPLYFILIASFSDPYSVAKGDVTFWPRGVTLEAYRNVFNNKEIWIGYRNSIVYTALGTMYNLLLTIPAAYVLSKKWLPLRTGISWFFFVTMFFGGGMVPTYLLIKNLGLLNTPWVLIIGAGVSCFNLIVTRQYFTSSIPEELYEAARIDGASEIKSFAQIAIPLAGPIIAVMALYYGVGHWNSYYSALIYVNNKNLHPLQLVLRRILIQNETMKGLTKADIAAMGDEAGEALAASVRRVYMANAMKYAIIFIASLPMLLIYPFIQKYFVKGVMIGSVKG